MDKDSEIESLKLEVKILQLKLELAESNSRHWERMYHISDDAFNKSLNIQRGRDDVWKEGKTL